MVADTKTSSDLTKLKVDDRDQFLQKLGEAGYKKVRLMDYELDDSKVGDKIVAFGWVQSFRGQKMYSFGIIKSGEVMLPCVLKGDHKLTRETSVDIWGTIKKKEKSKDEFLYELDVEDYRIYGGVQAGDFPITEQTEKSIKLDLGHLTNRLDSKKAVIFLRAELLRLIREYYYKKKYTEVTPPTIVQNQVEGGSTLFKVDYYKSTAYLTQSSQLYLETVAPVLGRAYCMISSYRAELSKTSRHLSEYMHVEAEMVDITYSELMDEIEGLVKGVSKDFYEKCGDMIRRFYGKDFKFVEIHQDKPFKRLPYKDAIAFLREKGHLKQDGTQYEVGDDIADASERFICEEYGHGQPVFLMQFLTEHKPFYMKNADGVTESCDLLFPGIGEITGGSMRIDDIKSLEEGFKREDLDPAQYAFYLDMARFGPSCHGGYGLGFERLLMGLLRLDSVDQCVLYPRKVNRCTP